MLQWCNTTAIQSSYSHGKPSISQFLHQGLASVRGRCPVDQGKISRRISEVFPMAGKSFQVCGLWHTSGELGGTLELRAMGGTNQPGTASLAF